ncbi:MAG: phosphomannomutase/phosphoglucomutase, partial [Gemmatimonadota bacterium]
RFRLQRPIKVVVDCGNGTGSLVAVQLLEGIGAEVVPLYCESDGTFPNHHPDPVVDENLVDLIARVREEQADIGVAFDGDADRIGAVDEQGRIVRGDILLLLFGLDVLERRGPGQKLIFDVKCSQAVPEVYTARGGEAIMWKTGHSLIKEKMRETGAPVAGELSGHICFSDTFYGFDDALYAACRLVDLVARSDRPLSARVDEFPKYVSTPEIRVDVPEEQKFEIVRRAVEEFSRDHEVISVDGARILFDDGWGLLRASNTQPVIVLRFEARTPERLEAIRRTVEGWLENQGVRV